ncbi:hypothetical protein N9928_01180 [bacterium]|nr:hypothetical protein [bacterium]
MKKLSKKLKKKELIDYIHLIRPKHDAYNRVCKSLGIENNILGHFKELNKSAESILDEHCTTVYNKNTGEEEIESSKSAVVAAMEDFAKQYHKKQSSLSVIIEQNEELNK